MLHYYYLIQRNLGVIQENPSSTDGVINILRYLMKYVPKTDSPEGEIVHPTVVYGDGLSCERHNDAQLARANEDTYVKLLNGLEPGAQEFHKRMLLLQVSKILKNRSV